MANKKYVQEDGAPAAAAKLAETPPAETSDPALDRLTAALVAVADATAEVAIATTANAELLGRLVARTDSIERQVRGQTEAAAKALAKMSARSRAARDLVAELRADPATPAEPGP
jgi:hypothetical protein